MFKTFFTKFYGICGGLLVAGYVYSEWRGVSFSSNSTTRAIPKAAKSSRGYRSPGFWFVGYHGGK